MGQRDRATQMKCDEKQTAMRRKGLPKCLIIADTAVPCSSSSLHFVPLSMYRPLVMSIGADFLFIGKSVFHIRYTTHTHTQVQADPIHQNKIFESCLVFPHFGVSPNERREMYRMEIRGCHRLFRPYRPTKCLKVFICLGIICFLSLFRSAMKMITATKTSARKKM